MSVIFGLDISPLKIGLAIIENKKLIFSTVIKIKDVKQIEFYKIKYKPKHIFIGLPVFKKEEKNSIYNFVKSFTHSYRKIFNPFSFVDESYTSEISKKISKSIDETSAFQIGLWGTYLESN